MEKTLVTILIALALLLGIVGGAVFAPTHVEIKKVPVLKLVNVSVNRTIEVPAPSDLNRSVAEFLKAVDNEEDEAGHSVNVLRNYDPDEVSVSRVYDQWSVRHDSNREVVNFRIKLRFDEPYSASEKRTYNVTVRYHKDHDTRVIVA